MNRKIPVYLYYAIAFLWLWSGLQPIISAQTFSINLLMQVGLPSEWRYPTLIAASVLDIFFAVACLSHWRYSAWIWQLQFSTVLIYSMIIAFRLPEMWLHPFAPLIKNIPILAILFFLYQQNKPKEIIK